MQVSRKSFVIFITYVVLFFPLIIQISIDLNQSKNIEALLIRVGGAGLIFPLLLLTATSALFSCQQKLMTATEVRIFNSLYLLSILGITYAIISSAFGFVWSNEFKYILGDTLRFSLPFLSIIAFLSAIRLGVNSDELIEKILLCLVIDAVIRILIKFFLVSTGTYYGSGLNQFMLEPILMALLFFGVVNCGVTFNGRYYSRRLCFILLLLACFAILISFKRASWALSIFILALNFIFYRKVLIGVMCSVVLVCTFYLAFSDSNVFSLIIKRFEYSFIDSNGRGIDSSSFERLAEVNGVIYTLGTDIPWIEPLTGRGSGAEFKQHPKFPMSKAATGSEFGLYHHIHSFYFITIFRHGLIGLLAYLAIISIIIVKSLQLIRKLRVSDPYQKFMVAVMFGCICQFGYLLIRGISSNSIYGNASIGIYVILFMSSFKGLNSNRRKIPHE